MKQTQDFKMSVTWAKRFVDQKKLNDGWKVTDIDNVTQTIQKPNGKIFALFNTKTGVVTTDANVMEIQW